MEEHRIPVDYLVGTSGGAIVGAWYATGLELLTDDELSHPLQHRSPADMKLHGVAELLNHLNLDPIFRPFPGYEAVDEDGKTLERNYPFGPIAGIRSRRFTFTDGVVPGEELERFLDRIAERTPKQFLNQDPNIAPYDRLPTPFRAVATQPHGYDAHDWERIVLGGHASLPRLPNYPISLQDGIRASMAIPYVFTPRYLPPIGSAKDGLGYGLVDGGLKDNYPTDVACDAFNPDVVVGLQIKVDLGALSLFYGLTGHAQPSLADLQLKSNSFKFGVHQPRRPTAFSVRMRQDHARPDQFDDWRHLGFLGYRSMEKYVVTSEGKDFLKLALSPEAYRRYRLARRARTAALPVLKISRGEIATAAELTSKTGFGSTGIDSEGVHPKYVPRPRAIGQTQFFADAGGSSSTGDLTSGYLKLNAKSYGFGTAYSSLNGTFRLGPASSAKINYIYTPQPESWFVKPFVQADSAPVSAFQGGVRIATEQVGDQKGGLEAGILLGHAAKASIASEIGNFSLQGNRHFLQQIGRFRYDEGNSELFSTRGLTVDAFARDLSVGSDLPNLYQAELSAEYRAAVAQNSTLIFKGEAATSFGANPPFELEFGLGGFGSLEGYPTDWVRTPSYQLGTIAFAKRIQRLPFFVGVSEWISGIDLAQASDHGYQDLFTGLLISTRATKFYTGISASEGYRPRLLIGFGNRPFASRPLLGVGE
jgi:predicted acylesterase/phospholipase RssA